MIYTLIYSPKNQVIEGLMQSSGFIAFFNASFNRKKAFGNNSYFNEIKLRKYLFKLANL